MEVFKYIIFTYAVCISIVVVSELMLDAEINSQHIDNNNQMKTLAQDIFSKSYPIN